MSENAIFCPVCGSSNPIGGRFCQACGARLEAEPAIVCPGCGMKSALGTKSCPGCGYPITAGTLSSRNYQPPQPPVHPQESVHPPESLYQPQPVNQHTANQTPVYPQQAYEQPSVNQAPIYQQPPQVYQQPQQWAPQPGSQPPGKKKGPVIALVAVIAVVVIGLIIFAATSLFTKDASEDDSDTVSGSSSGSHKGLNGFGFGNSKGDSQATEEPVKTPEIEDTDTPVPDETAMPESTDEPGPVMGGNTYANSKYGFTFEYPDGWSMTENDGSYDSMVQAFFLSPQAVNDTIIENINIAVEETSSYGVDFPGYMDLTVGQLSNYGMEIIQGPDSGQANGIDTYELVALTKQDTYTLKQKQVYYWKDGICVVITFTASTDTYDEFSSIADAALYSLSF